MERESGLVEKGLFLAICVFGVFVWYVTTRLAIDWLFEQINQTGVLEATFYLVSQTITALATCFVVMETLLRILFVLGYKLAKFGITIIGRYVFGVDSPDIEHYKLAIARYSFLSKDLQSKIDSVMGVK